MAIDQFNLLIIAAIGLPFMMLTLIITASGHPKTVLKYVITAASGSFIVFYFVGSSGNPDLIPLGIIAYYLLLGIFAYFDIRRRYGFPVRQLFRAIGDTLSFLKERFVNKERN